MYIKEIYIEKSRTVDVQGLLGRDHYRKVIIGMTMDLNVDDDYSRCYATLSDSVDNKIKEEITKMKGEIK